MQTLEEKDWKWIEENLLSDPLALRLKEGKGEGKELAILQIECRQRGAKKLPQTLACPRFLFPTALSVEQCSSDLLAGFHSSFANEGESVLDLTAGLGIDAIHFARKASRVTAVERDPQLAQALRENCKTLGIGNLEVLCGDCREFLSSTSESFDLAFIDPSRRGAQGQRLFALKDCSPDVAAMTSMIQKRCRRLLLKASPMLDPTQTLRELPQATALYAAGTAAECRELLALADFASTNAAPLLHCATLGKEGMKLFTFTALEERSAQAAYSLPKEGEFLYEPYASVMKMQPVKLLCQRYGAFKLHKNTHLYASQEMIGDFPGEPLRILEIRGFSRRALTEISKRYPRLEIAVRNFPVPAEELRKRMKAKEGRDTRLVAATLMDGSLKLIICARTA